MADTKIVGREVEHIAAGSEDLPSLSRRLSDDKAKPPRHRKYPSGSFTGSDKTSPMDTVGHLPMPRSTPEDHPTFKDRVDRPQLQRQGQSIPLLDRLSVLDDAARTNPQDHPSLRERLVPSKRDRDEMAIEDDDPRELAYEGDDGNENKRARRKNTKTKRGGRR